MSEEVKKAKPDLGSPDSAGAESREDAPEARVEEVKSAKGGSPKEAKAPKTTEEISSAKEETKAVPAKFKKIVEEIEEMSVLNLHELVKVFEAKFGVSAAAVAVGPAVAGGAEAEEKTSFDVELSDAGAQKIAVIKAVKEVLGLGLKEAKDLVDAAPSMLKEGMKKEEAETLKSKVEEAGGKVTLK